MAVIKSFMLCGVKQKMVKNKALITTDIFLPKYSHLTIKSVNT